MTKWVPMDNGIPVDLIDSIKIEKKEIAYMEGEFDEIDSSCYKYSKRFNRTYLHWVDFILMKQEQYDILLNNNLISVFRSLYYLYDQYWKMYKYIPIGLKKQHGRHINNIGIDELEKLQGLGFITYRKRDEYKTKSHKTAQFIVTSWNFLILDKFHSWMILPEMVISLPIMDSCSNEKVCAISLTQIDESDYRETVKWACCKTWAKAEPYMEWYEIWEKFGDFESWLYAFLMYIFRYFAHGSFTVALKDLYKVADLEGEDIYAYLNELAEWGYVKFDEVHQADEDGNVQILYRIIDMTHPEIKSCCE